MREKKEGGREGRGGERKKERRKGGGAKRERKRGMKTKGEES